MTDPTPAPSPAAVALVDLARLDPSRVVADDLDRRITAAELEHGAAAVAAAVLARAESAPSDGETWVPVYVDRSVESIMAFHGLVRSGRPFALIDPALPAEAIARLHRRMGNPATAIVARAELGDLVPPRAEVLAVADLEAAGGRCHPQPVDPTAAAMILFTSGSTGQPKGVMRAWSSFERIVADQTLLRPGHVLIGSQYATFRPLHFAAAGNPMVAAALGSTIHVLDPGRLGVDALLAEVQERRLDSIDGATSLVWALVRAAKGERLLPVVTSVTFGGDPTPWALIDALRAVVSPEARMVTRYGSTETGGFVHFEVTPSTPIGTGDLPIGVPGDRDRLRLEPLEPGSPLTQILVRDPDAVGYLGDPELTAERFVTDVDGARWWVSGDLAVVDADGVFHHRGRSDDIVKINGVLVAPIESERAIRDVPGVADVVVLPDATPSGRWRLVAHVRVDDPGLTPVALRDRVQQTLAGPLVPSVFVRHEEFPYSVNGKIDRIALQAAVIVPWTIHASRRPGTDLEWAVCGVCAEVLELAEVNPDDDLWFLGLDSLAAVELCVALAAATRHDLDPRTLLTTSTPGAIAELLASPVPAPSGAATVLNADADGAPLFVVPGAAQTVLAFRSLARAMDRHRVVVIEARGMHGCGRPDRTIETMAARVVAEIDRALGPAAGGPCVVAGHSAGATVAYEAAQQRARRGAPTSVVLIDGGPCVTGGAQGLAEPPPRPGVPAPSMERLRGHGLRDLPGIVVRQVQLLWYSHVPTRPRPRPMRYVAMYRRSVDAVRRYRGEPATFPCTLVHVAGSGAPQRVATLVPDLVMHEVGGDHRSCIEYPHSLEVAAVIIDELGRIAR